ncbi:MAG: TraR/DksA C4-type zinc finger protein [Planctomycetales bacterium]|nr:TraR/DksA C4-type zinc finger protein [Planctomycetales bacterium]MCA9163389.1 TraR/DksA C4-type zinc finger protein [Planctomycetales bacterium]MCA9220053.1 TraR/DksA C4-type zinc finger protein [Planctomycetales bacterium]MCA9225828.1 TraR/DksA C4-type zinc finger protein [Planctomycetales bacterium]
MDSQATEQARAQLEAMRDRLTNSIRVIDRDLAESIRSRGELSHLPTHNADHDAEGVDAEIALEQNEETLLEAVTAALARIREGSYGECENCHQPIAEERLEVIPYAAFCVECERKHEQQNGGRR